MLWARCSFQGDCLKYLFLLIIIFFTKLHASHLCVSFFTCLLTCFYSLDFEESGLALEQEARRYGTTEEITGWAPQCSIQVRPKTLLCSLCLCTFLGVRHMNMKLIETQRPKSRLNEPKYIVYARKKGIWAEIAIARGKHDKSVVS